MALLVIFALEKYPNYSLTSTPFIVFLDQQALRFKISWKEQPRRMARCLNFLENYEFGSHYQRRQLDRTSDIYSKIMPEDQGINGHEKGIWLSWLWKARYFKKWYTCIIHVRRKSHFTWLTKSWHKNWQPKELQSKVGQFCFVLWKHLKCWIKNQLVILLSYKGQKSVSNFWRRHSLSVSNCFKSFLDQMWILLPKYDLEN